MTELLEKDAGILGSAFKAVGSAFKRRGDAPRNLAKNLGTSADEAGKFWHGKNFEAHDSGDSGSVFTFPFQLAAEKMIGKDKVREFHRKNIAAPALKLDMAIGEKLQKIPVIGKKMFRVKEDVHYGDGLKKTYERASALAPLTKARDLAEPIMVGLGTERAINHVKKMNDERKKNKSEGPKAMANSDLHEKVASALVQLRDECRGHEKRAHATRLLWKEVELGLVSPPGTFEEYEEKIASLVSEDLAVLERALKVSGGRHSFGEVPGGASMTQKTAEQTFVDMFLDNDD